MATLAAKPKQTEVSMSGYAIEFKGNVFTPNGRADIADTQAHNAAIERQELQAWAAKPDHWVVYVTDAGNTDIVTTWLGTKLGDIYWSRTYRGGFGGTRMRAIQFRGTNGESYHGRFGYDWGELCRVRKMK